MVCCRKIEGMRLGELAATSVAAFEGLPDVSQSRRATDVQCRDRPAIILMYSIHLRCSSTRRPSMGKPTLTTACRDVVALMKTKCVFTKAW